MERIMEKSKKNDRKLLCIITNPRRLILNSLLANHQDEVVESHFIFTEQKKNRKTNKHKELQ